MARRHVFQELSVALLHSIELHDSVLHGLEGSADLLSIRLRPSYLHLNGKGWIQNADIVIREAVVSGELPESPVRVSDGALVVGCTAFENLIPLPLVLDGVVRLSLGLPSGDVVHVTGRSVQVVLHGEPRFVEDVP